MPMTRCPMREHLRVVREDAALDREAVVRGDGADAGDLVRGDRDSDAGAAQQDGAVGFALGDQLRRRVAMRGYEVCPSASTPTSTTDATPGFASRSRLRISL